MSRTPEQAQQHLDSNKRPHPRHPRKTVPMRCLGTTCGGRMFMSFDKAANRMCPSCARHSGGIDTLGHVGVRVLPKGKSL